MASCALAPGTALGITTGAALPDGADAILRVEDAALDGDRVTPAGPLPRGLPRPLSRRGRQPRRRARARRRDRSPSSASPRWPPPASARSRCAGARSCTCIATGTELLEVGAAPEPGRIHESNRLTLRMLAERAGADVVMHPVVPDDPAATRAAVEAGARRRRAARLRRRLGRPARPRQAGARGSAASTRCSGASGSSPASRCGSGAATRPSCSGSPATRSPPSRASCCSSGPRCGGCRARRTRRRQACRRGSTVPARPADGRTTLLTARLAHGADGMLEATPTEGQGSHLTGALGASDAFAVIPVHGRRAARRGAGGRDPAVARCVAYPG